MINYSIVIPHKDIPDLLQRCLDSIPQREDLEIIVVDDNSNPEVVDFNHFPGKDRDDVKIIFTKEGRGAGYARNVGLEHVIGKWIIFADADDFFTQELSTILDDNINADFDVIYFNVISVMSDDITKRANRDIFFRHLNTEEQLRGQYTVPWGKIIRRYVIENYGLRFEEVMWCNDMFFCSKLGTVAKSITKRHDNLYVVTYRIGSLSTDVTCTKEEIITRTCVQIRSHNLLTSFGNYTKCRSTWSYLYRMKEDLGLIFFIKAYKAIDDKHTFRKYVIDHSTTKWRRFRNRTLMILADLWPNRLMGENAFSEILLNFAKP